MINFNDRDGSVALVVVSIGNPWRMGDQAHVAERQQQITAYAPEDGLNWNELSAVMVLCLMVMGNILVA